MIWAAGYLEQLAAQERTVLERARVAEAVEADRFVQPPGGAGGQLAAAFGVLVKKTGGAAGSETAQCAFIYSAYRWTAGHTMDASTLLGSSLTPARARTSVGPYVAPADGTWGLGCYDGATFVLLDVLGEVCAVTPCACT